MIRKPDENNPMKIEDETVEKWWDDAVSMCIFFSTVMNVVLGSDWVSHSGTVMGI